MSFFPSENFLVFFVNELLRLRLCYDPLSSNYSSSGL